MLATSGWTRQSDSGAAPAAVRPNLLTRLEIQTRINHLGPFTMVLDTGAERTVIASSIASALSLPAGPVLTVHDIAEPLTVPSARVERLAVAGRVFRNLTTPLIARERLAADGLVGLDVLHRFKLSLDFVRQTAALTSSRRGARAIAPPALTCDGPCAVLPSTRGPSGRLLLQRISIGPTSIVAFMDSGAQHSVGNSALERLAVRGLGQADLSPNVLYGLGATATAVNPGRLSELHLGSVRLRNVDLLFADLHSFDVLGLRDQPALLLGADIMGRFDNVTFDFASDVIIFEGLHRGRQGTRS